MPINEKGCIVVVSENINEFSQLLNILFVIILTSLITQDFVIRLATTSM